MQSTAAILFAIAALALSACGSTRRPAVGEPGPEEDAGTSGASGGLSGAGALGGAGGGGGGDVYRVAIHAGTTVLCPDACTEITAEAVDGHAPYSYEWSPAIGDGAGPHTVCPDSTMTYSVTARDAAIEGEFGRPSQSAGATIAIVIDEGDARGCDTIDGGRPPDPPDDTTELCTVVIPYSEPAGMFVVDGLEHGSSLATDSEGNLYLAGTFGGRIDLGGGSIEREHGSYGFVAKYDASCDHVWSRTFGKVGVEMRFVAVDVAPSGAVVIGGSVTGDIELDGHALSAPRPAALLFSLDGDDASVSWAAAYSAQESDAAIRQLAVDGAGEIVFSGFTGSPLVIDDVAVYSSEGPLELLAKVSASGQYRFAYDVTGTYLETRLAVHDNGTIALTSWSPGPTLYFGIEALPLGIEEASRRYVAVIDPNGAPLWGRALDLDLRTGDASWPVGTIAFDREGNVLVEHGNLGDTADPGDVAQPERLSKLDPGGALAWSREVPSGWMPTMSIEGAIATDAQGNVVHTSEAPNLTDAAPPDYPVPPDDAVVQKLAPDSTLLWRHVLDHDIYDGTFGLAIAPDDAIWVGHGRMQPLDGTLRITKLAP